MEPCDRLIGLVARAVPVDADTRRALAGDARRLGRERGGLGAAAELAAIVLLVLELRSTGHGGRRRHAVCHGLWLGGEVALILAAASLTTGVGTPGAGEGNGALGLAITTLVVIAVIAGRRWPGLAGRLAPVAAVPVVGAMLAGGSPAVPAGNLVLAMVGATGLAVGSPRAARFDAPLLVALVSVAVCMATGAIIPAGAPATASWLALPLVVALLAGSQVDPVLGVAAAVLAAWRFLLDDPAWLLVAATEVADGASVLTTARIAAMVSGFLFTGLTVRRSLQQATTI